MSHCPKISSSNYLMMCRKTVGGVCDHILWCLIWVNIFLRPVFPNNLDKYGIITICIALQSELHCTISYLYMTVSYHYNGKYHYNESYHYNISYYNWDINGSYYYNVSYYYKLRYYNGSYQHNVSYFYKLSYHYNRLSLQCEKNVTNKLQLQSEISLQCKLPLQSELSLQSQLSSQ